MFFFPSSRDRSIAFREVATSKSEFPADVRYEIRLFRRIAFSLFFFNFVPSTSSLQERNKDKRDRRENTGGLSWSHVEVQDKGRSSDVLSGHPRFEAEVGQRFEGGRSPRSESRLFMALWTSYAKVGLCTGEKKKTRWGVPEEAGNVFKKTWHFRWADIWQRRHTAARCWMGAPPFCDSVLVGHRGRLLVRRHTSAMRWDLTTQREYRSRGQDERACLCRRTLPPGNDRE